MSTRKDDLRRRSLILVIEDDIDVCNMLKIYLAGMDYEVIVAVRGADGVDQAVSVKPDLVILDINLPDIDGFEVLRQFVERKVRTRVMVFTPHAHIPWMVKFIRAGVCAYVTKPVEIEDLKQRVNSALKLESTLNFYRIGTLTGEVNALLRKAEEQYEELMRLQLENRKLQDKLKRDQNSSEK